MAGDLNQVTLIGRLGKDPEIRSLNNGDKVANFSIATSEQWKTKDGEKKEKTEWHNVVVWGNLVKVVEQYVHKGDKIMVQGKLTTEKYEKDGIDRYATKIVLTGYDAKLLLLGSKSDREGDQSDDRGGGSRNQSRHTRQEEPVYDVDDEIPF